MDKLIEALQAIIEVASGERQVAEDDTEGMAWIDKRARAAVRAHDAQLDAEAPAEPGEDVVSRASAILCDQMWEFQISHPNTLDGLLKAIIAEAREGYYSLEEFEKAIIAAWYSESKTKMLSGAFMDEIRARLAPKPSLAERVTIVKVEKSAELPGDPYQPWGWDVRRDGLSVFTTHNKIDAERYAAGLRAELAALEADNGGI